MRAALPLLVAAALVPVTTGAQDRARATAPEGGAVNAIAPAPSLSGDATRVRVGAYHYDVIVTRDSSTMTVGTHRVSLEEGMFAGAPAWMVVEHRESREPFVRIVAADTVLLSRRELVPHRWDAQAGDARFVAAFTNDSVYGGATSPLARQTFSLGAPVGLLTSEGALDVLLQTVSLHPGWSASAMMLVADLGGGRLVPVTLSMALETSVDVPAGRFDTWVVLIRGGGTDRWIWLDRETQVVVKSETLSPHMPDMRVERVLTHAALP